MPSKLQRLFVKSKLAASVEIELNQAQANYLGNVLRLRESDELLLFNGSDGGIFVTNDARAPVSYSPDPITSATPV